MDLPVCGESTFFYNFVIYANHTLTKRSYFIMIKKRYIPLLVITPTASFASAQEGRVPNIILICADDLGWSDLGCYGSEIQTPNLDKLAANGLRFNNFHNSGKSFPSRACLITGLYAQQNGYDKTFTNPLKNSVTFGEVLQEAGYTTLWSGKHHGVENPYFRGFDRYYGLKDGCCNYFNPGIQREGEGDPARKMTRTWCIDSVTYTPYTPKEKDFYTTDYYTNYALDWLKEYSTTEKPFFLYLAYNAPHDPLMAWEEDIDRYRGKYREGYDAIRRARYAKQLQEGVIDPKWKLSAPTHPAWESLSTEQQKAEEERMEIYAAMIECMDRNIGRVVEHLEESGELDNTLIIFVSDNGASAEVVPHSILQAGQVPSGERGSISYWESLGGNWANVSNTPFRYHKNSSYEGGVATPMIVSWGDNISHKGEVVNSLGHFIDIMPTLCDVAGAKYPNEFNSETITALPGQSLLPVILGDKQHSGDKGRGWKRLSPLFFEWGEGAALNDGEWKIVRNSVEEGWRLYDVGSDPSEINDLSGKHPEIVTRMGGSFEQMKAEMAEDAK